MENKSNQTVIVELEFGIVTLQKNEIVKFGNPFYPAKKRANWIKKGDLVLVTGFFQHVLNVS